MLTITDLLGKLKQLPDAPLLSTNHHTSGLGKHCCKLVENLTTSEAVMLLSGI